METGFATIGMLNGPSADTFEYLLVVQPDAAVRTQVMEERYFFNGLYRRGSADDMPPDIAIAAFTAREAMEDILIRWLRRMIAIQPGFTVTLNNYGAIPAQALYLRVQDQAPFLKLSAGLEPVCEFLKDNHCPPLQRYQRAFIPLASRLQPAVFEKAVPEYARRSFHASFEVQQLVLIRKSPDGSCRKIQAFGLMPAVSDQYAA